MKPQIKSHPIWAYVILAYAITWLIQLPELILMRGNYHFTGRYLVLLNVASYGPSLAAVIVTAITQGGAGVKALLKRLIQWRVSWLVYLVTFFVFPLIFFIGYQMLGIRAADGENLLVFMTLVVAIPINAPIAAVLLGIGPLGEELGWRGFMLPRLLERYGDFSSSVILGLVWAFWHLPVFLFAEWRGDIPFATALALYPLGTIAIATIMTKLHHWSRGSVLMAILFHGVINYVADSKDFWQSGQFSPLQLQLILIGLFMVTALVFWALSKTGFPKQIAPQEAPQRDHDPTV
ncbi:MAG: CPBP family intramembrane metalloprotease [Anaerolineae bacterium]|nr:CPBP family intramembrane metalloprotease [Anaerolineae bacterium]